MKSSATRKIKFGKPNRVKTHKSKRNLPRAASKSKSKSKSSKKWVTAIAAAQKSLNKTGSVKKAHKILRQQALLNAKKLFGTK
jgi:hypothetical protein